MTDLSLPLSRWGFGLAGVAYAVLAAYLLGQGYLRRPVNRTGLAVVAAALLTCAWAVSSWVAVDVSGGWIGSMVIDIARYAAWFVFVSRLIRQGLDRTSGLRWMEPLSWSLPLAGLVALAVGILSGVLGPVFLVMMLLSVFGLVLVEQLFRNLPEDAQWSAKPISLGLAGIFVFDLYLFSQAVLFGGIDPDALSIRGLVHAALMPLLLLSTTRHRNWIGKIRVSQKAMFHSASLLMVGAYLLFIAAVG